MPHRILHIVDSLQRTGTAQHMKLLALGLPRAEFDTHVCALAAGGPVADVLRQAGVPVTVIGRRWAADPMALGRLMSHAAQLRPDTIVAWQPAGRAYAAEAARRAGRVRLVAVWRTVETNRGPLRRFVDRRVVHRADTVVATCHAVREGCIAQGLAAEKIVVISSGTPTDTRPTCTREQLLAQLHLPENARLIGWAAAHERDRGGKDAIWAADLLKVIRDDTHLLVLGNGPHRARLARFRDQVEIADRVHFLGDRGDFDQLLPLIDQFWSTGRRAGPPQALLEALAAGVPVIAADVPGVRDLVEHEKTGCLFAPGHRAGIARWAEHLLDHPEAALQIGAAGRKKIENDYSAEQMFSQWAKLLSA